MRTIIAVLLIATLIIIDSSHAKRKTKKAHRGHKHAVQHSEDAPVPSPMNDIREPDHERHAQEESDFSAVVDPCYGRCRSGEVCELSNGIGMCVCIPECPEELDPRRKVCSNLNTTFGSECELHQMRCWCRGDENKCTSDRENQSHMHIDYYGSCQENKECVEGEMADFPRRMREWLFAIMRDSSNRDELSTYYHKMEREAETDISKRWINSAIWKFCDLDTSRDRSISRHEIFPIRAPLISLEHCIAPFLDKCDSDNDHEITLKEWAKCLEIDEDDIDDRCEEFRNDDNEE